MTFNIASSYRDFGIIGPSGREVFHLNFNFVLLVSYKLNLGTVRLTASDLVGSVMEANHG